MLAVDPVSLLVNSLAAGAAAGMKPTAARAITDAYAAVKRLVKDRHGVDVAPLERNPASEAKRQSVAEDLRETKAGHDEELLEAARQLVAAVREHDQAAASVVGVDLSKLESEMVRVRDVVVKAKGSAAGVSVRDSRVKNLDIEGVRAEGESGPGNP